MTLRDLSAKDVIQLKTGENLGRNLRHLRNLRDKKTITH